MNYSSTRASKVALARVIPVLSCATFLVIVIVKSSLALSLGLVGALSIVRFRTPIKEPEELTFLFLSIASGLGYGAGQNKITTVVISTIIIFVIFLYKKSSTKNIYCVHIYFEMPLDHNLAELLESDARKCFGINYKLIRKTVDSNSIKIVVSIQGDNVAIGNFQSKLSTLYPSVKMDFITSSDLA
jgi:hypothetical protein